jgi:hypothetical protein
VPALRLGLGAVGHSCGPVLSAGGVARAALGQGDWLRMKLPVTETKEETTRGSLDSLVLTKESKTEERKERRKQ